VKSYDLAAFDVVPSSKEIVSGELTLKELPTVEQVRTLATWTGEMLERFDRPSEFFDRAPDGSKQDRSAAMGAFTYLGAENGWSDEQLMTALLDIDDRWGKYKDRRDRDKRLLDFINRARTKVGYNPVSDINFSRFMDDPKPVQGDDAKQQLVYGAMDFVAMDFKVEWLLQDLMAQGGFGFVTGYPGVGKTQFALQIAANLALGYERFLKWPILGGHKKVLFLSLEMAKAPLNLFLGKITQSYADKRALNRNLLVAPLGVSLPLDSQPGQAFLNNILDEYMPDIIVIDSLQKAMSKEMTDELSVKSVLAYLATTREKYNTSILVIHHNRKKSNDAQKKDIEQSDVYGSYLIVAEADFVLSLRKLNGSTIGVDMLKNRLGPMADSFEVQRDANLTFHFSDMELAVAMGDMTQEEADRAQQQGE
jgi:AAA domain